MVELKEQIDVVRKARLLSQELFDIRKNAMEVWEKQNEQLLENVANTKQEVTEAENQLRELTIDAYNQTGNKKPADGVGIREITKLLYDEKTAFTWATEHKMALKLDTKAFESIAKTAPPDFVQETKEIQATIASNL